MKKEKSTTAALKDKLSALVKPLSKPTERPMQLAPTAHGGGQYVRVSMSLFQRDLEAINRIVVDGLKHGKRLNQSQAVRLALRSVQTETFNKADFDAIQQDDKRRAVKALNNLLS